MVVHAPVDGADVLIGPVVLHAWTRRGVLAWDEVVLERRDDRDWKFAAETQILKALSHGNL